MRLRRDMRRYQRFMVDKAVQLFFIALWAEPGLGKTISALTAMIDLLFEEKVTRWLVVAPKLVAETTWPDEIAEWEHTRNLRYSVIVGTAEERAHAARSDAPVHIINRENLIWLWNHNKKDLSHYDGLVYDEADRLKEGKQKSVPPINRIKGEIGLLVVENAIVSRKADKLDEEGRELTGVVAWAEERVAAIKASINAWQAKLIPRITEFGVIMKMRPHLNSVIELTGTPSPNGLEDLWGPAYVLDQGRRLQTSKNQFYTRYFSYNKYKRTYTPHDFAFDMIMSKLKDCCFALKSDDYLQLPPITRNVIRVKLEDDVMRKYKELEREFVLEEHDIEAVNSGVLTGKLLQLANGSVYRGPEKEEIEIHDTKLDALETLIRELNGKPLLVAYEFQFDLRRLKKRFPHGVVLKEEPDVVRKWNAKKIPLLFTHPGSAAYGLNMQTGGHHTCWFGLTWSLVLWLQFNKRLHRSGQTERVFVHCIIATGTFDERQLLALNSKGATQDSVTEACKAIIPN